MAKTSRLKCQTIVIFIIAFNMSLNVINGSNLQARPQVEQTDSKLSVELSQILIINYCK